MSLGLKLYFDQKQTNYDPPTPAQPPFVFFTHLFKNRFERFDVAVQHSLWQTGNETRNGSETARFTPGYFFEMAILYF